MVILDKAPPENKLNKLNIPALSSEKEFNICLASTNGIGICAPSLYIIKIKKTNNNLFLRSLTVLFFSKNLDVIK
jgi:hypothetical protein